MIHFLTGRLAEKHPTRAVLDVNGVGYLVNIPTSTYENLSELGSTVHLHTMLHVRDDAMQLFGFGSMAEREVFETMLSVSGIGPKLALAALSAMKPSDIRDSVVAGDTVMLTRIPGVGRKTAERMIVELRDRMAALGASEVGATEDASAGRSTAEREDALAALQSLGFSRVSAEKALRKVLRDHPDATKAEAMIRLALRENG